MLQTPPVIEHHPLEPFLPSDAQLLMLGSFPPPKRRWSMEFYYPNMQNDMWRIVGSVFFDDPQHFIVERRFDAPMIQQFCRERGIALYDTARRVIRRNNNASDQFLEVVEAAPLHELLRRLPKCRAITTTGQKATDTLMKCFEAEEPTIGSFSTFTFESRKIRLYRMPSSSRAYPLPLPQKVAIYAPMFAEIVGIQRPQHLFDETR